MIRVENYTDCCSHCVAWFKPKLISREGRWEKAYNRISKAVALRQTGYRYWDVGFSTREESVSLRLFNYSYQSVLDFHIRRGTVYIEATQKIKHGYKCKGEPHHRDTKTPSDAGGRCWRNDRVNNLRIKSADEDVKMFNCWQKKTLSALSCLKTVIPQNITITNNKQTSKKWQPRMCTIDVECPFIGTGLSNEWFRVLWCDLKQTIQH